MPFHKITYSEKCRRATLHNWGCNFRCQGCTYKLKQTARPDRYLDIDAIYKCLRGLDLDAVHFMGGEPTTNPELPEMLAFWKCELDVTDTPWDTRTVRAWSRQSGRQQSVSRHFDEDLHREYTGHSVAPSLDNFPQVV